MGKPKPGKNMEFDPIEMIEKNAEMNRIDQTNPYGSSKYAVNPETGNMEFKQEFSPELKELHGKQLDIANKGSIKDPLAHLAGQGGGEMGGLMESMFGRMKSRYMGEEGTATSRHENVGKGGGEKDMPQADPMAGMSTSTKVREMQEKEKLARIMAGTDQKAPYYPQPVGAPEQM